MADKAKGRVVWLDLMTSDPDAAIEFYSDVVGWSTRDWGGQDGNADYRLWLVGETPIGGVMTLPEEAASAGAPPSWMAHVGTDDIATTVKQVEELGGQIAKAPTEIPNEGSFAVCIDPQGAVFAVFEAEGDAPGHDGEPGAGEFSWHELATTDYKAAFEFYSKLFGWEIVQEMDMGPAGIYLIYGRKGRQLGGMFNKSPDMPMPPMWIEYASVRDVHSAADKVKAKGGQVIYGPMEVPGGDFIAQCIDPQGAMFALHSKAI